MKGSQLASCVRMMKPVETPNVLLFLMKAICFWPWLVDVGKERRGNGEEGRNLGKPRNPDANGDNHARQGRESRLAALVRHEGQKRKVVGFSFVVRVKNKGQKDHNLITHNPTTQPSHTS